MTPFAPCTLSTHLAHSRGSVLEEETATGLITPDFRLFRLFRLFRDNLSPAPREMLGPLHHPTPVYHSRFPVVVDLQRWAPSTRQLPVMTKEPPALDCLIGLHTPNGMRNTLGVPGGGFWSGWVGSGHAPLWPPCIRPGRIGTLGVSQGWGGWWGGGGGVRFLNG